MLVISRQRDESIVIGDDVEVIAVEIRGEKVRLGVIAPRHIAIHRKEVYEAIKNGNQQVTERKPSEDGDVLHKGEDGGPKRSAARRVGLVLTRHRYESIMIGDEVELTVVDIRRGVRGNTVRLGVTALRHVTVHRKEVYQAIKGDNP